MVSHIQNLVVQQNSHLRVLQETPTEIEHGANAYMTNGQTSLQNAQENSFGSDIRPSYDKAHAKLEVTDKKFIEDNKQWILGEVEKYLENNSAKAGDYDEEI